MADREPDEELADSPGHDRGWQQPAGKHRWRQDPGESVNQDPRRTYREPPDPGLRSAPDLPGSPRSRFRSAPDPPGTSGRRRRRR